MESDFDVRLLFERGDATADELQAALNEVFEELRDPGSEAAIKARAEGLDPAEIGDAKVTVEETKQGVAPVVAAILIGLATNAAYDVAKKGWTAVVWPRVKKRLGGLALGNELLDEKKVDDEAPAQDEGAEAGEPRK